MIQISSDQVELSQAQTRPNEFSSFSARHSSYLWYIFFRNQAQTKHKLWVFIIIFIFVSPSLPYLMGETEIQ